MYDARVEVDRTEIKELLVKRLRLRDVAPESIDDHESLVKGSLGLDSLDILELALAIEEVYGVKIADEQLGQEAFRSVASLAEFIGKSRSASNDADPSAA